MGQAFVSPAWADRVMEVLEAKERSKDWLARRIGIHPSMLSRLMGGDPRYRVPDDLLARIARELEVPRHWLTGEPPSTEEGER